MTVSVTREWKKGGTNADTQGAGQSLEHHGERISGLGEWGLGWEGPGQGRHRTETLKTTTVL